MTCDMKTIIIYVTYNGENNSILHSVPYKIKKAQA